MKTPAQERRSQRIAENERRLEVVNRDITAAEWGDDFCYTNGKMDRLQKEKDEIVHALRALKAVQP